MFALFVPGLQESDWVRGESWREGDFALSQQLRGLLGKLLLKSSLGRSEKRRESQREFGRLQLGRGCWDEQGRNAQLGF